MRLFTVYRPSGPGLLDRPHIEGVIFRDGSVALLLIGHHHRPRRFHRDWAEAMRDHHLSGSEELQVIFHDGHPERTPESGPPDA